MNLCTHSAPDSGCVFIGEYASPLEKSNRKCTYASLLMRSKTARTWMSGKAFDGSLGYGDLCFEMDNDAVWTRLESEI